MSAQVHSLYRRLGGYDAITAAVENLLPRLMNDAQLETVLAKPRHRWDAL